MCKTSRFPVYVAATLATILLYGTMDAASAIGLRRCHELGGVSGSDPSCPSGSICSTFVAGPGGKTVTRTSCIDALKTKPKGPKAAPKTQ